MRRSLFAAAVAAALLTAACTTDPEHVSPPESTPRFDPEMSQDYSHDDVESGRVTPDDDRDDLDDLDDRDD